MGSWWLVMLLMGFVQAEIISSAERVIPRLVGQVVKQSFNGCHLLLVSNSLHSPLITDIIR